MQGQLWLTTFIQPLNCFLGRHIAVHLAKCHTVNIDVSRKAALDAGMPAHSLQVKNQFLALVEKHGSCYANIGEVLPESGTKWKLKLPIGCLEYFGI